MIPNIQLLIGISAMQAVFSDTISTASSIYLIRNEEISNQFRTFALCILIHFVGFSLLMVNFFDLWYISGDAPKGKGWVMFSIMSIIQTYYGQNVLQSKLNFQQPPKTSKKSQIICIFTAIFACAIFFIGGTFRTIPSENSWCTW